MSKLVTMSALVLLSSLAVAEPSWQQSEGEQIELGIRDRNPTGEYSVVFVVTGPSGEKFRATRRVIGDQWSHVLFPKDFATDFAPGQYRWSGNVDDKAAVGGRFTYDVKKHQSRLTTAR